MLALPAACGLPSSASARKCFSSEYGAGRRPVVTAGGAQGDEAAAPGAGQRTGAAGGAVGSQGRVGIGTRTRRGGVAFCRPWGPGRSHALSWTGSATDTLPCIPAQPSCCSSGRRLLSLARPVPDVTACSLPGPLLARYAAAVSIAGPSAPARSDAAIRRGTNRPEQNCVLRAGTVIGDIHARQRIKLCLDFVKI